MVMGVSLKLEDEETDPQFPRHGTADQVSGSGRGERETEKYVQRE